jgi:hypothetical protein
VRPMEEPVDEPIDEPAPMPPWLAGMVGVTSLVLLAAVGALLLAARGKELKGGQAGIVVGGTVVFALLGLAGLAVSIPGIGKWFARRGRRGKA